MGRLSIRISIIDIYLNGGILSDSLNLLLVVNCYVSCLAFYSVQTFAFCSRGCITLVALAPLTNIALACRLDPDFTKRLKHIYIMGGNVEGI